MKLKIKMCPRKFRLTFKMNVFIIDTKTILPKEEKPKINLIPVERKQHHNKK